MSPSGSSERGSVLPLLLVAVVVGLLLVVQVGRLGAHAVAQARAETAADAAALAAADALALGRGPEAARRAAIRTARANGAVLDPDRCDCTGRLVTVEVSFTVVRIAGFAVSAEARSRAEIRPFFGEIAR